MTATSVLFKLAWEQFVEHYRAADNRLLRWTQGCLLFLLLLVSMISFNIQQYLARNFEQLLGADVVVTSFTPIGGDKLDYLKVFSKKLSRNQLIDVTLGFDNNYHQVQLKVVDSHYPVQGYLQVSEVLDGRVQTVNAGPAKGELWVDSRLFVALQLSIGDEINLAGTSLRVSDIIVHEPDRLMQSYSMDMRAMVHQDSLDSHDLATNLLATKLSNFRYLMASDTPKALADWATDNITGVRVLHRDAGHPLATFWLRVENFIGLSSVLLFLMAAIGVDLISRRHLAMQKNYVAVIMSMGASRRLAIAIGFMQWLIAFVALLPIILLLVYVALYVVTEQLQGHFVGLTMMWSWAEVFKSSGLLLLLLLSFQVPGAFELAKVTVADLIRSAPNVTSISRRLVWSLLSIGGLAAIYADNWLLTAMTLGVMLMTVGLLMGITWTFLTVFERLTQGRVGMFPFAVFMMKQRLLSKSTQILGVGLCAMLLLSTLGLMEDFGDTLAHYHRTHDGNLIVTRANNEQVEAIKQWALDNNSSVKHLKSFAPAQLVEINGLSLIEFTNRPSDSMLRLQQPIRLHFTDKLPLNNRLIDGKWWQEGTSNYGQVSVEEEILMDIGMEIGDTLTFQVDGEKYTFEIVSGHVYRSGYGTITFLFQVPLSFYTIYKPTTLYMGSLELPEQAWDHLWRLWQCFPTLKMLSIAQLKAKFDVTADIVIGVVGAAFVMMSLLAVLVIITSVKGYEVQERRKNGLLLSFGQSKVACLRLALYEWLVTGLIAAVGAVAGTIMMGNMVFESQFNLPYYPNWFWLLSTAVIVVLVMVIVGLIGSRASLQSSPKALLQ